MELAKRVTTLTPSATLAITAKAKEMKARGIDVISLGAGEPDFNTPAQIIDASYEAMKKGKTGYTPSSGLPDLKEVIIDKLARDQQLTYRPEEIIVTSGSKQALYLIFQTLIDPGDEVIIPAPYWVSYPEQVKLAGGQPVIVEGKEANSFKITAEQLEKAITERTKALVLNSPNNPTGMMYTKEELEEIGEVCTRHQVWIISDEIYEKLIYGEEKHVSIAQLSPALKERTIIVNGVSKSHAMTGFRIGFA
ncbi:MAG: pyridoxal phosphate-dependent aminotransferase, partial [Caldibacillus sp.]